MAEDLLQTFLPTHSQKMQICIGSQPESYVDVVGENGGNTAKVVSIVGNTSNEFALAQRSCIKQTPWRCCNNDDSSKSFDAKAGRAVRATPEDKIYERRTTSKETLVGLEIRELQREKVASSMQI